PQAENLSLSFDFLFQEVILPVNQWHLSFKDSHLGFGQLLEKAITSHLAALVKEYLYLLQAANHWYCLPKKDLTALTQNPIWGLDFTDFYKQDLRPRKVPGETRQRVAYYYRQLSQIYEGFALQLADLQPAALAHISESLYPSSVAAQEQHAPHLGLLFAFLELFRTYQGDLNQLTEKHRDFLYEKVLQLPARPLTPDQVHVVFELQEQVPRLKLDQGRTLSGGQDANGADRFYQLNEEIILDHAQLVQLMSLRLFTQPHVDYGGLIQSTHIAPVANSQDGLGEAFAPDGPKNWPTLGGKFGKKTLPGFTQPALLPYAQFGLALASPVLLLEEGHRTITLNLDCKRKDIPYANGPTAAEVTALWKEFTDQIRIAQTGLSHTSLALAEEEGLSADTITAVRRVLDGKSFHHFADESLDDLASHPDDKAILGRHQETKQLFRINLSGEEEWINPKQVSFEHEGLPGGSGPDFRIKVIIELPPEVPAVTFFNGEVLTPAFSTQQPVIFLELEPDFRIPSPDSSPANTCELEVSGAAGKVFMGSYEFLRQLTIANTHISVKVCGLKNVVVQNDENLQDVNEQIYPFGVRPSIDEGEGGDPDLQGSNFFVGSQEIFCKRWDKVIINLNWKDKPADFCSHYTGYSDVTKGINDILEENFKIRVSILQDQEWKKEGVERRLFEGIPLNSPEMLECRPSDKPGFQQRILLKQGQFPLSDPGKELSGDSPLTELNVGVKNGFARFTLQGQDFQHSRYPFILARQMMAFGKFPEEFVFGAVYVPEIENKAQFETEIKRERRSITDMILETEVINSISQVISTKATTLENKVVNALSNSIKTQLKDKIFTEVNSLIDGTVNNIDALVNTLIAQAMTEVNHAFSHSDYRNDVRDTIDGLILDDATSNQIATARNDIISRTRTEIDEEFQEQETFNLIEGHIQSSFNGSLTDTRIKEAIKKGIDEILEDDEEILIIDEVFKNLIITPALPSNASNELKGLFAARTKSNDRVALELNKYQNKEDTDNNLTTLEGHLEFFGLKDLSRNFLRKYVQAVMNANDKLKNSFVVIPNEPYTPIIKDLELDYEAQADKSDMTLFHLHPFPNTLKKENLNQSPPMVPVILDEGSLFMGLENINPGGTTQVLFQLAESTADTEIDTAEIEWAYLRNNVWTPLRPGFELITDDTRGLKQSGIIKFLFPNDFSLTGNTQMPPGLYWLRATARKHVAAVCDTINIHTQAAKATYVSGDTNTQEQLADGLPAGEVADLAVADSQVAGVTQPYRSFGGREAEQGVEGKTRMSERLRHKGRAVSPWDYERLVLQEFPVVATAKTLSQTLGLSAHVYEQDLNLAPGHVGLALIPDLNRVEASDALTPRLPLSVLEDIERYLQARSSPFISLHILNPRYEPVAVELEFVLQAGLDRAYYEAFLSKEISQFLAPWTKRPVAQPQFGREIREADLVQFIETRSYVVHITDLKMKYEQDTGAPVQLLSPRTPRSILTAGTLNITASTD
ncbi:MAG: hypothetical protein AAFP92_27280, partial [Bacteroidota bacterium]